MIPLGEPKIQKEKWTKQLADQDKHLSEAKGQKQGMKKRFVTITVDSKESMFFCVCV